MDYMPSYYSLFSVWYVLPSSKQYEITGKLLWRFKVWISTFYYMNIVCICGHIYYLLIQSDTKVL